ncbi:hypothetical protein RUM43_010651 [Polyplax serrata]|uniref:Uncharacterized protein n=1 Tax=Polyplax serrata TaxID=468196 RepID=A0AAN8S4Z5_POLSC
MREEQIEVVEAEIVTVAEDSGEDDGTECQSNEHGELQGEVTVGKIETDIVGLGRPLAGEAVTDGTGTEIGIDMIVIGTGTKAKPTQANAKITKPSQLAKSVNQSQSNHPPTKSVNESISISHEYGPPTRTEYRLIVENLSSRVSWQLYLERHLYSMSRVIRTEYNVEVGQQEWWEVDAQLAPRAQSKPNWDPRDCSKFKTFPLDDLNQPGLVDR